MDLFLKNKIALITASSKGLGFATAKQLVLEGAIVIINGRNENTLSDAKQQLDTIPNSRVFAIAGDVSYPDFSDHLMKEIQYHFDGLDILITNAGGPPAGCLNDFSIEDWEKAINTTFLSHVRLIQATKTLLLKSTIPSILTITSAAVKQPIPNMILSNSIRAATVGLTKSLANEFGSSGIRVNSILPGWTDTERVQHLMQTRASLNHSSIEEEYLKQALESPLRRLGKPEEFARVATFLVSPAASYINGVMLVVDGGMNKGTY
ncbi:MAG: SDR family oxidoreductase [Anaerolineaceae bacterium]